MTTPDHVVVDASYMIDVLLGCAELPGALMSAPAHFDAEVVSALLRLHRREVIDSDDLTSFVQLVSVVDIRRLSTTPLIGRVVELRDALAIPDAWYVALAEGLEAALLTADLRLASACRQHGWCDVLTPAGR